MSGKHEAQQRADRIRAFRAELEDLERERVLSLTPEQRQAVETHQRAVLELLASQFDIDTTESEKQISWGMRIASTLGAIALCIAVFLFFYRYWGVLSTPVQVTLLTAAPLAMLAATEFAARRERTLYYAGLAAVVAMACFVLDLSVAGQIFNLTPTKNALAVWGAFAMLLAYHYGLRLLLAVGLAGLLVFSAALMADRRGFNWVGERPENIIFAGALTAAAGVWVRHPKLTGFPAVYRGVGLFAALAAVEALAANGRSSYLELETNTIERCYQVAGLATSAGTIWLGITRQWRETVNVSAVFFVIYLLTAMAHWFWDWMPRYLFFLLVGAIGVALVALFKCLRGRMQAGVR